MKVQVKNYEYPLDLGAEVAAGRHYMLIDSYESRTALETEGSKKSSIALYIPPNALKTTIGANQKISFCCKLLNINKS